MQFRSFADINGFQGNRLRIKKASLLQVLTAKTHHATNRCDTPVAATGCCNKSPCVTCENHYRCNKILSLRSVARIQTGLNSCGLSQLQNKRKQPCRSRSADKSFQTTKLRSALHIHEIKLLIPACRKTNKSLKIIRVKQCAGPNRNENY